ncbi:GNAT family N-acetyltransferase [Streptomyces zagrosensis]|uniref:GNAT superfamily N-acetyltransferase n=1 Tax=Streptomyces zagrosensis TaxID=1042984 RepID=A0A7W9QA01_9ACTN|nr:GNAT family N-acetyltransferase [Streptomyces zagrosensis]MBB5936306.1 GNAT superfamily N-acetyltransferase [Streptomyces zagrosensis]
MTVIVRDFRPEDAEAVAAVRRAAVPFIVATPESVIWQAANAPAAQRYRLLIGELDGHIVATAHTGLAFDSPEPGKCFCNPSVHPDAIGRGVGSAMLAEGERYLAAEGAQTIYVWALDNSACLGFAERRGYQTSRGSVFQRLDLANVTLPPLPDPADLPAGVELRTAADFADRLPEFHEADTETSNDEPSDVGGDTMGFAEWRAMNWEHPLLDRELSIVVTVDGAIAAFTIVHTDRRDRYQSGMTGTRRAYRGRGLATLAKTVSLHRAQATGFREAFTTNDTDNQPMLAINRRYGYEPTQGERRVFKTLG